VIYPLLPSGACAALNGAINERPTLQWGIIQADSEISLLVSRYLARSGYIYLYHRAPLAVIGD
jgi:hypothetical protein